MTEIKYPGEHRSLEPFEAGDDGLPKFADVVFYYVKLMGWSVEQFGMLYGKAVKNSPYTKERIYQMIRDNTFPRDPYRRWVIARLLQIPPVLLGLSSLNELLAQALPESEHLSMPILTRYQHSIDLEEFQTKLKVIESGYQKDTVIDALYELAFRLDALHQAVLYSGSQANSIKRLICGYQMTAGNMLRNQFHTDEATKHLTMAVILAKEEQYEDLYVKALIRRGVLFLDLGKIAPSKDSAKAKHWFTLALNDFEEARSYINCVDLSQRESILLLAGATRAHLALDRTDTKQILKDLNAAGNVIHQSKANEQGIYYLDRASAFIASPVNKLHDTTEAFDALEEAARYIHADVPRRYAYMHITEALVHFDKGWYPTATELATEALAMSKSGMNVARIATLYESLRESSYGKSIEVAELGIDLIKVQYADLF